MKPPRVRCCSPKTPLGKRAALTSDVVRRLSELFGILSSESRIRILHAVARAGELNVQAVAKRVGMKVAAVSNQLRLMEMMSILGARTEGLYVYYFIVDPCVPELLETGACLAIDAARRIGRKR